MSLDIRFYGRFFMALWPFLLLGKDQSIPSMAPEAWVVPQNNYQFELLSRVFQTHSVFDEEGEFIALMDDDLFMMKDIDLNFRYSLGKRSEISVGGKFRQIQAQYKDEEFVNSGPESFWGGMKLSLINTKKWSMALKGLYRQTLYSNDKTAGSGGEMILGDAGKTVELSGHMSYPLSKKFLLALSLGYRERPEHLSSDIPLKTSLSFHKRRWALSLGGDGVVSLGDDQYSDGDVRDQRPQYFPPVTKQFNSLNRSWIRGFIGLTWSLNLWRFEVEMGSIQAGKSTDQGADVKFKLVKIGRPVGNFRVASSMKKMENFKEYSTEGKVIKVSPRGKYVKINKGRMNGVQEGIYVDIFKVDHTGNNILYASGIVHISKSEHSIIKILKMFTEEKITIDMIARMRELIR